MPVRRQCGEQGPAHRGWAVPLPGNPHVLAAAGSVTALARACMLAFSFVHFAAMQAAKEQSPAETDRRRETITAVSAAGWRTQLLFVLPGTTKAVGRRIAPHNTALELAELSMQLPHRRQQSIP